MPDDGKYLEFPGLEEATQVALTTYVSRGEDGS